MNTILYGPSGLRWLMLVGWMIIIFAFSSQPNSSHATESIFGAYNIFARKLAHMCEYGILFLLACRAFTTTLWGQRSHREIIIAAFALSILYACSDELHQSFVPGRSPSIGDVGIDTIGMVAAWLIITFVQRRFRSAK